MAVSKEQIKNVLQTKMNYGIVSGSVVRKTKSYPSFGQVKAAAADQDIFDTASAIATMQEPELENTYTVLTSEFTEE